LDVIKHISAIIHSDDGESTIGYEGLSSTESKVYKNTINDIVVIWKTLSKLGQSDWIQESKTQTNFTDKLNGLNFKSREPVNVIDSFLNIGSSSGV
jgi:hypothetical protein